jgi:hypothetical protein
MPILLKKQAYQNLGVKTMGSSREAISREHVVTAERSKGDLFSDFEWLL